MTQKRKEIKYESEKEIRDELLKERIQSLNKESDFLKRFLHNRYSNMLKKMILNILYHVEEDQGGKKIFNSLLVNATILDKFVLDELKGDTYKKPEITVHKEMMLLMLIIKIQIKFKDLN